MKNGNQLINPVIVQNFTVSAWDSKERLVVSLDLLKAAFRENELLREYCTLPEVNRTDPSFINTYVLEALMAVIRQAHRSPGCRNIRPNPSRADQVQVLVREGGERWEILTLAEAVRLLFRDAAGRMEHIACTAAAQELTQAERTATFLMPTEYRRRPEKYEREGKGRLAAHLAALGAQPVLPAPQVPDPRPEGAQASAALEGPGHATFALGPAPLEALLRGLSVAASEPQTCRRPPPFSPEAAVALLRACPPVFGAEAGAALQRLADRSGQDPSRIVNHLWDAKEDGLLSEAEKGWVVALARAFDESAPGRPPVQ